MTTAEFRARIEQEEAECNRIAALIVGAGCVVITLLWAAFIAEVLL